MFFNNGTLEERILRNLENNYANQPKDLIDFVVLEKRGIGNIAATFSKVALGGATGMLLGNSLEKYYTLFFYNDCIMIIYGIPKDKEKEKEYLVIDSKDFKQYSLEVKKNYAITKTKEVIFTWTYNDKKHKGATLLKPKDPKNKYDISHIIISKMSDWFDF